MHFGCVKINLEISQFLEKTDCKLSTYITRMTRLNLRTILPSCVLVLVAITSNESCPGSAENFEHILQTRQLPGKFQSNDEGFILSRQPVHSMMECLDTCLRTVMCGSFGVVKRPERWGCRIYKHIPHHQLLKLIHPKAGWMHFNASSYELQKVSFMYLTC